MRQYGLPAAGHWFYTTLPELFSFSYFILIFLAGMLSLSTLFVSGVNLVISTEEAFKLVILVSLFIFALLKISRNRLKTTMFEEALSFSRAILTILFSFTMIAFLDPSGLVLKGENHIWFLFWCLTAIALVITSLVLEKKLHQKLVAQALIQRRIAVFGAGEIAKKVYDHLESSLSHITFSGLYDDRPKERVHTLGLPIKGKLADLIKAGRENKIDQIIIALPQTAHKRIACIAGKLEQLPLDITVCTHISEDIFFRPDRKMNVSTIGSVGLLNIKQKPINEWGQIQKKVLDYSLSSLALIALSPLMAIIALAIKLESKGPVIFKQKRHGLNHREINVFKFRTMAVQENGNEVKQAQKNDPRITKVGAFLRKTSLDELPQLLNILRGEMSLVGPRPHALVHNLEYEKIIEEYANRHQVKPGLTGWAQVNGQRGETPEVKNMEDRVSYDLEYINSWSFRQDLKIIFMTPFYALMSKNAY